MLIHIQSSENPQHKIAKLIASAATKLSTVTIVAYILHALWKYVTLLLLLTVCQCHQTVHFLVTNQRGQPYFYP